MKKFVINDGYSSEQSIEAVEYLLREGYWHFLDEEALPVLTIKAEAVTTIERA